VVVGTAGTVIKWMRDRYIKDLSGIKIFVVDEADEMVKESNVKNGSSTQVLQIKNRLPENCQTLCFSATYPSTIMQLAKSLVGLEAVIMIPKPDPIITPDEEKEEKVETDKIFQVKIECRDRSKVDILDDIYSYFSVQQSMIFCETKKQCDEVKEKLTAGQLTAGELDFTCSVIYGKSLDADKEFELFRQNKTKVLICTDILARGIDVPTVTFVINYNAPRVYDDSKHGKGFTDKANCETYTHRIGRCSRFGDPGTAITLLETACDKKVVSDIEQYYGKALHGWDEDEIETLSLKHAALQSGARMDAVLNNGKTRPTAKETVE
jgi:ATP-dependent RNA helicase DDX19/DBP5